MNQTNQTTKEERIDEIMEIIEEKEKDFLQNGYNGYCAIWIEPSGEYRVMEEPSRVWSKNEYKEITLSDGLRGSVDEPIEGENEEMLNDWLQSKKEEIEEYLGI